MPEIKLPDGKKISFSKTINGIEIAKKIGQSLAKDACIMRVNDELKDLLDELADRYSSSEGGPVKPLEYLELAAVISALSEEEKKNLQFMLDKIGQK